MLYVEKVGDRLCFVYNRFCLFIGNIEFKLLICIFCLGDDEVTVGKFYATFLIQDYFRRFKKCVFLIIFFV